jgi:hypothetical protein
MGEERKSLDLSNRPTYVCTSIKARYSTSLGTVRSRGSTHSFFEERNKKPTEQDLYFKFPTSAYVFSGGGGDFHKCSTSVESPCKARILGTIA